ncbi:MAG: aspartate aminotransferase family protein [Chloroflexi bacterium]|nr:aspartate aminotransferase family protein [Chloroflexota bacterium]
MITLPPKKSSAANVLAQMRAARDHDARWRDGKVFSLVYFADDEILQLTRDAYELFFSENGLNPMAFPSLKKFEAEVIAMTASLLGGDAETVGNLTTGGTESILLAVKTAREWGRAKKIAAPEMILPASAHPAFDKAAHYFDVQAIRVPVARDLRADVGAMKNAITRNAILIVGSAPAYPHGVVDPIAEIAHIAREREILCHVDACVGGFVLPFVRQLGYAIPDFDFRIPGVTSLSVDLHKYAYAAKGASVILYKNRALRRHQFFATTDWSGGIYISPTMTGTRAGGAIAAAYAVLNFLGEEGYLALTDQLMRTTTKIKNGINALDGVRVLGNPAMSILAIGSNSLNVYEIADELQARGWHIDRQQFPPSLHLTITPAHAASADQFLADLRDAVAQAKRFTVAKTLNAIQVRLAQIASKILPAQWMSELTARVGAISGAGAPTRSAAMYGMIATLPNRGDVNELVLDVLDGLTRASE